MAILALHGGAGGDGEWKGMSDLDPDRLICMQTILKDLGPRLESGDLTALEAVTLAVEALEDEPLYNAGRGSVLAEDERIYMDASIMRGEDQAAGSVVNVERIRHPIRAANLLLKKHLVQSFQSYEYLIILKKLRKFLTLQLLDFPQEFALMI